MAATCDVCSDPAELIVVSLAEQEAECLCWACLTRRMMETLAAAVEADDGQLSGVDSEAVASR